MRPPRLRPAVVLPAVALLLIAAARPPAFSWFMARASDGVLISVTRFAPPRPSPFPPVVCFPEVIEDARAFGEPGGAGLAPALARRGFDVWVADFRGQGGSREWAERDAGAWTFDDLARRDVPAAVEAVRERTGARGVTLLGHGIGGTAALVAVATGSVRDAHALVLLAAPAGWKQPSRALSVLADRAATLSGPWAPARAHADAPSPFDPGRPFLDLLLWQTANVPDGARRDFLGRGLNDFPSGVARQLARWVRTGRFDSEDGADYGALLPAVKAPTLALVGNLDVLSPTTDAIRGFEALGATDKTLRVLSPFSGTKRDVGHLDLLLGENVDREVFAPVAEWLAARP